MIEKSNQNYLKEVVFFHILKHQVLRMVQHAHKAPIVSTCKRVTECLPHSTTSTLINHSMNSFSSAELS